MKKAHELSLLCNLKIAISFYDPENRNLFEFLSDPLFTMVQHVKMIPTMSKGFSRIKQYKLLTFEEFFDDQGKFDVNTNVNLGDSEPPKPFEGKSISNHFILFSNC